MITLLTRFQYLFISGLIPNGQTALSLRLSIVVDQLASTLGDGSVCDTNELMIH